MQRKINVELLFSVFRVKPKLKHSGFLISIFLLVSILILWRWMNINDTPKFMDVMNERKLRVLEVCNAKYYEKQQSNLQASNLYWLRSNEIVWCPIYKAAASTWRNHLINVLKQTHEDGKVKQKTSNARYSPQDPLLVQGAIRPSRKVWAKYVQDLSLLNNNLTGFLVVRHPFQRLVSAYRDKLERNNLPAPFYYQNFGKLFVKKYREKAILALGKEFFTENNNFGTPLKVPDNRRPNADLPSFWEFAQSVIDGYKMDEHWQPIFKYCSICNPTTLKAFKYILKFENLLTEEKKFLELHHWNISDKDMLKLNINRPKTISSDEITKLYFSILSKEQIKALYKVYELDFILFDYSFEFGDLVFPTV